MDDSLRGKAMAVGTVFVALLLLTVLLSAFYRHTARTRTLVLPFDVAACDDDGDCGLVNQVGCCPCEAGGGQGAVNPRMRGLLKEFLRHACRERSACVAVSACRPDLESRCRDHRCVLLSPTELSAAPATPLTIGAP